MTAAWMLFALVTGSALSAATAAVECLAAAGRHARRFVWVAALVTTAGWPAATYLAAPTADTRAPHGAASLTDRARRLPTLVVSASRASAARRLDAALLTLWVLASGVLLARLATSAVVVGRRRRAWPSVDVDGLRVRVSPDLGPAVLGLHPMDVVQG